MLKLRSSTIFHLLCGAIALEALGLLGMVAAMLYPLLVPGDEQEVAGLEPPPAVKKAASLSPYQSANRWMVTAWPPPSPDEVIPEEEAAAGPPVDSHERITFVGSVLGPDPGDQCGFFQRQTDRRQWSVWVGQERENLRLVKLTKDLAVVEINGEKVALNKVAAMAPGPAAPRRGTPPRGSRPSRPTPENRGSTPAAATVTTSGSYRLATGSEAGSSGRQPSRRSNAGAATTSQSATLSRGSVATSTPNTATAVRTGAGGSSVRVSSTPGTSSNRSSTNWRQYWADRLKRRREAEQGGQAGQN